MVLFSVPLSESSLVVFLFFFLGSQSVLTYATSHGLICGWDLRSSKLAWKLENDPAHGNVNVKPRLNDQTFLSNIVFVAHNVGWLNEQTMFDQTSNKLSPHNAFFVLPLKL